MKTLAFGKAGDCIIFVCGKHPIDNGEWDSYLFFLEDQFGTRGRYNFLVFTGGAGPTAGQRQKVNDVIAPVVDNIKAAVLTSSQLARGIVTVLAWIFPVYHAFTPDQVDEAIQFLGVAEPDAPKVKQLLADLQEELVRP
jgi:hypothetical protein